VDIKILQISEPAMYSYFGTLARSCYCYWNEGCQSLGWHGGGTRNIPGICNIIYIINFICSLFHYTLVHKALFHFKLKRLRISKIIFLICLLSLLSLTIFTIGNYRFYVCWKRN
jgi:hypothetical protein